MADQPQYPMQNRPYPQQGPNYPQQGGYYNVPQNPQYRGNYQPVQQPYPQQQPYYPNQVPNQPQPEPEKEPEKPKKNRLETGELLSRIFVGLLTAFVVVYMGWLFAPSIRNSMSFWPTNTPSPVPPTATIPATATVTPLPTNTPTPAPTATPGPISTFWIRDGNTLDPAVPNAPEGLVILSVKNSAEISPDIDSIYWTSSMDIVQDLGMMNSLYDSEWYATTNSGTAQFFMDQSLKEGLYEIYIMDTYYSSGGSLDYVVKLGDNSLQPLTGCQTVDFMTSQFEPRQTMDTWRSIGIYYIMKSRDILTVSTSWGPRDQYTYVAADRVMIVPRKMTDLSLLNKLPSTGRKYLMDDTQATVSSAGSSMFRESESVSWDDSYEFLANPKENVTVEYSSREPWPIGHYALYAYFPESRGGLEASVQLYTDDTLLNTDNGDSEVNIRIPEGGDWSLIGNYTTDRYYERPVRFKIKVNVEGDQQGEYPIDAIALLYSPFGE